MHRILRLTANGVVLVSLSHVILGCGQTTGPEDALAARSKVVIVNPAGVVLSPGEEVRFSATVLNPNGKDVGAPLSWQATGGTISSSGRYTAGPKSGNYVATARSGNTEGTARILITNLTPDDSESDDSAPDPVPTTISVAPTQSELQPGEQQRFTATVRDQNGNVMSAPISWSASGGSITSTGTYTAGPESGSYFVTAGSGSLSATADVSIVETSSPATPTSSSDAVVVNPGESIQTAVDRQAAGTTFLIKAGVHRRQSVRPKDGMTFVGESGAVLDGEGSAEYAFRGDKTSSDPDGVRNITIRGLEIRNYNSPLQNGAIRAGGSNFAETTGWVIENCEIHDNAGGAIRTSHQMIIRGNYIHSNGQIGIAGKGDNILVEDNEIAFNNTRDIGRTVGLQEFGGTKFVMTTNIIVRNNYVHDNKEVGLWFDIDNTGALIENNRVVRNDREGIRYEISYRAVIRNNYLENNALNSDSWHRGAISISSSPDVEIYGNTLVGNGNGIVAISQTRNVTGRYGTYVVDGLYVRDNEIRQTQGVATGLGIGATGDTYLFEGGNRWERNSYQVSSGVRWAWDSAMRDWTYWSAAHPKDGPNN